MNGTDSKHIFVRRTIPDSETMFDNASTTEDALQHYNDRVALQLTPVTLFLGILMLVGFFGNLMVCYIYTVRLKAVSSRLFLVSLAVLDLIMCSLCIPVEIVSIRYMYLFNHNLLCKSFGTILLYCSLASGSILVAIAVDRYKLICKPFGKQMTLRETRRAIYLCLFSSVIGSAPSWITQGKRTVPVPNSNITGSTCATSDDVINTHYPLVYHGFQAILFVAGIVILSSLYSRILMRARKQMQFREKLKRNMLVKNEDLGDVSLADETQHQTRPKQEGSQTGDANFEEVLTPSHPSVGDQSLIVNRESHSSTMDMAVMSQDRNCDASHPSAGLESLTEHTDKCDISGGDTHLLSIPTDQWTASTAEETVTTTVACGRRNMSLGKNVGSLSDIDQIAKEPQHDVPKGVIMTPRGVSQKSRALVSRTTTMMIVITVVFVVSFLPHLCAMGARSVLQKTFDDLDGTPLAAYHLCFRSYFINAAVNPLVYSSFNLKFRNEVKGAFRRMCGRNTGT